MMSTICGLQRGLGFPRRGLGELSSTLDGPCVPRGWSMGTGIHWPQLTLSSGTKWTRQLTVGWMSGWWGDQTLLTREGRCGSWCLWPPGAPHSAGAPVFLSTWSPHCHKSPHRAVTQFLCLQNEPQTHRKSWGEARRKAAKPKILQKILVALGI